MRLKGGGRLELFIAPTSINIGELSQVKERPGLALGIVCGRSLWLCGREGGAHPFPGLEDLSCAWETSNLGYREKWILGFSIVIEK